MTESQIVLAIDIGGTKIATGLVDEHGALLSSRQEPNAHTSADVLYDQVLRLAQESWDAAPDPSRVVVCGVGSGGPARNQHELLSPVNIPEWRDFDLRARLAEDLKLPTHVDNDAKALALGEGWMGAARGVDNYIAMVVSTGVGGGIVLGGRLLHGADGNAGHIGHVFVQPDGHPDALGVGGLLEGSASGTAIAAMTGADAAEASEELRHQTGVYVGRAVASVANLLDLQLAVIAGSVALGFGETFFDAAQETVDELSKIQHAVGTRVIPAGLGSAGPLIGAGAVGWTGEGRHLLQAAS